MSEVLNINQDANFITASQQLNNVLEQLDVLKKLEEQFRKECLEAMLKYEVKSAKIGLYTASVVAGTEPKEVREIKLDTDALLIDYPEIYQKYMKVESKTVAGRATTLRITKNKEAQTC